MVLQELGLTTLGEAPPILTAMAALIHMAVAVTSSTQLLSILARILTKTELTSTETLSTPRRTSNLTMTAMAVTILTPTNLWLHLH